MGIFARSGSTNRRAGSVATPVCCRALRGASWSTVKASPVSWGNWLSWCRLAAPV